MKTPAPRFFAHPSLVGACIIALSILGVGVARSAAPSAAMAPAPNTIAIVNLEKLFAGLQELKDRNDQIGMYKAEYTKQLDEMDRAIKALEAELKDNIPATDRKRRAEKGAELAEAREVYKIRTQRLSSLLEIRNNEVIRDLYQKSFTAIAPFAQREGYDLILLDDRDIQLPEMSSEERLNSVILSKRVLFAKGELDVTDRLLLQMNAEYAAGAGATKSK